MHKFYLRLAFSNINKNKPVYFPFLLTNMLSVMVFFIMASIQNQSIIAMLPGSYIFVQFLKMGVVVTGLFAGVFLLYTNQLLIRQRKKELGLYNIFGLEKKHIVWVLGYESLLLALVGLLAGMLLGLCLGKMFFLILLKLIHIGGVYAFAFSKVAFKQALLYFGIIALITLIYNSFIVVKAKPVELLYAAQKGDNYKSFVGLKAVLGGLCLIGAYALILTTPSPIDIIGRIIPIAVLILAGTFFFFSSCSVVLLQALKRNEKYYYKPNNFIAVSGLIYRLKQNAKGLANICILSTIVMIIATTTLALYVGQQEMISFRFPLDTKISVGVSSDNQNAISQTIHQTADEYKVTVKNEVAYYVTYISGVYKDNTFSVYKPKVDSANNTCGIYLITLADYNQIEGLSEQLEADEMFIFSASKNLGISEIHFQDIEYHVKAEIDYLSIQSKSVLSSETLYYFVCPTQEDIDNILARLEPDENRYNRTYRMMFDTDGNQKMDFISTLQNRVLSEFQNAKFENADLEKQNNIYTYGGFLFIGILLSLLFMIFLTLVIYYKQITEGYNDRYNFEVMQKVGLDRKEVSAVVHKEIRTMFFFPLVAAVVHLAVSLYAVAMLLATLGLTNALVLLLCAVAVTLLFVIIYIVMYFSTARVYCKIVMI